MNLFAAVSISSHFPQAHYRLMVAFARFTRDEAHFLWRNHATLMARLRNVREGFPCIARVCEAFPRYQNPDVRFILKCTLDCIYAMPDTMRELSNWLHSYSFTKSVVHIVAKETYMNFIVLGREEMLQLNCIIRQNFYNTTGTAQFADIFVRGPWIQATRT